MAFITVLIPAYNEAKDIAKTILGLRSVIPEPRQIIVIDDGSTDNTYNIAKNTGAEVCRLEKNRGKGTALNMAIPMVKGDFILLIDADVGYSAKEVKKLMDPVLKNKADVAIAKFPAPEIKGFGLVKKLARIGMYYYSGKTLDSILSGQRALTKKVFNSITPFAEGYSVEIASSIKIARLNIRVIEVPVSMKHRTTDRSIAGFYHRGIQFWHILRYLLFRELKRC